MSGDDDQGRSFHDEIFTLLLFVYGLCHIVICLLMMFFVLVYAGVSLQFIILLCALPLTTIPSLSAALALQHSKPFAKTAVIITATVCFIVALAILVTGWRYIRDGRDFVSLIYGGVNAGFGSYLFWRAVRMS